MIRLARQVHAYTVAFIKIAVQYRAELAIWGIAGVVQAVVYLAVWRAVALSGGGTVGGYDAAHFAGYFLVLLLVRDVTYTWVPYQFPDSVRDGSLSPRLLLPSHPLLRISVDVFCFRAQSTVFLIPVTIALFALYGARVETTWQGAVAGFAVLPLASLVRLVADSLLALAGFWLTRIDGLRGLYYTVLLFMGGQFAPIDVLPGWLQEVARALPFYWCLGYPIELLVGRADPGEALVGIAIVAAWALGLYVLLLLAWRRGVARYGAVSG